MKFTGCVWPDFSRNSQQRRPLEYALVRVRRTRASQLTQMKLCKKVPHVCASREEGCLPPRSRLPRASTTTTFRRRRLSSSSTTSVLVCVCGRMPQSRLRGEWQGSRSRHHHYPIPSARGDARGVWQWVSERSTATRGHLSYVLLAQQMTCLLVSSTAVSAFYRTCCLPRRMETRHDAIPDALFGYDCIRNWTPLRGGGRPEHDI